MRLARLELSDFRCFKTADLDLSAPVTFICGANASGKSSVSDSIEWALTGACRGTDLRGAGSKNLIRDGADGATVRLAFDDGTFQTRMLSRGGNVKAETPLGIDRDVVRALVSGQSFLDLAHADAKRLLMGVLNVHVDIDGKALTLDQVDAKYQVAFEARRNAKAALNAITIPEKPIGEIPNVEAIDAKLARLREQEHDLVAKAAKTGGKRGQLDRDVLKAHAAISAATKALAAAKIPDDLDEQLGTLNAPQADATAEQPVLFDAPDPADVAALRGKVSVAEFNMAYIQKHSPDAGCVMCADIVCKTPAKAFAAQIASLSAQLTDHRRIIAAAEHQAKRLSEQRDIAWERQRFADRLRAIESQRELLFARIHDSEEDAARLSAERDATPEDVGPSPELLTLRQRIASGEHISHEAREILRQRIAHEDAIKAQAAAAEKLQKLEQDVLVLGPKGARVKALAESVGAFEASINEALYAFEYVLKIQSDPWGVIVNGRSSELLSTSERMRVGLAFSVALASVVGSKWVVLDGADILDDIGRAGLGGVITAWTETGGQIIVTATRAQPLESDEGRTCYWLEDGTAAKS